MHPAPASCLSSDWARNQLASCPQRLHTLIRGFVPSYMPVPRSRTRKIQRQGRQGRSGPLTSNRRLFLRQCARPPTWPGTQLGFGCLLTLCFCARFPPPHQRQTTPPNDIEQKSVDTGLSHCLPLPASNADDARPPSRTSRTQRRLDWHHRKRLGAACCPSKTKSPEHLANPWLRHHSRFTNERHIFLFILVYLRTTSFIDAADPRFHLISCDTFHPSRATRPTYRR